MDISYPQTNMTIIVFIGGLLGNTIFTILKWWNEKGRYEAEGIKITFDTKFLGTAILSFVPVVVLTIAGFSSLLKDVNAANPVSYAAAFIVAFAGTIGSNYLANSQIKNNNVVAKSQLQQKIIERNAKLYVFNQKMKEDIKDEDLTQRIIERQQLQQQQEEDNNIT